MPTLQRDSDKSKKAASPPIAVSRLATDIFVSNDGDAL
jgi:hypothetical protein